MEQGDAHWTFWIYNTCLRTFFSVQAKIYLTEFYKQDFTSEVLRFNKFSHIFTFPFIQPPKSIMKHLQKDVKKLPVTYCNAWGKSVRCSLLFVFESGRSYMKCRYSPLQPSDNKLSDTQHIQIPGQTVVTFSDTKSYLGKKVRLSSQFDLLIRNKRFR